MKLNNSYYFILMGFFFLQIELSAMSCTDSSKISQPKIIKIDCSDDKLAVSGEPCIDFQPDDRWQIKDDESSGKVVSKSSDLKNSPNGRQSRRLRSSKSCDSNPTVNGEVGSGSNDESNNITDKLEELPEVVENHSKRKRDNSESETMPDCNTKKKVKVDDDSPKDSLDDDSAVKPVSKENTDSVNGKLTMPDLSPANSNSVDEKNTIETKDESIIELDFEVKETDDKKSEDNDCEVIPTLEAEKSNESSETANSNSEVVNGKNDDIEIINLHDDKKSDSGESDSEVQIISVEEDLKKTTSELFKTDTQDVHYTLTAGFPYYNSLKEKLSNFKAGIYKPVKFPHTGTLLLGESEVIIESPSLLVPLLIKETDEFPKLEGNEKKPNGEVSALHPRPNISKRNFFQSSVGQFLINLGMSRVQEWYHRDMRKSKMKFLNSAKGKNDVEAEEELKKHEKRLEELKKINAPFNFGLHRCKFCEFKTESLIVMDGHYLVPHVSSRREYTCNFCKFMTKDPGGIAQHYEKAHKRKAILDNFIVFHECVFCTFQSHLKNKVNAHMNRCRKHFIPSQNLSPPFDFEFPGVTTKPVTINDVIGHRRLLLSSAKNPRMPIPDDKNPNSIYARNKLSSVLNKPILPGPNTYADLKNPSLMKQLMTPQSQMALSGSSLQLPPGLVITRPRGQVPAVRATINRFPGPRGLTTIRGVPPRRGPPYNTNITSAALQLESSGISITPVTKNNSGTRTNAVVGAKNVTLTPISTATNRTVLQKPGPPQPVALFTNMAGSSPTMLGQPQARLPANMQLRPLRPTLSCQRLGTPPSQVVKGSSGNTFVVCEICDSYIKDLEELRTHMNWVHKVKIHPKMLVSRPPLNCQKCHWRFFTDQGLERHLLGAHGLVTTNMQEMANKNQDGGRCIICGAVFTYKLVSHMTQVHKVTLKPAHLSYKCTVCTATFTLYRLFESHVYNVHSGSAKRSAEDSSSSEPAAKKCAVEETGPRKCRDCGIVTENMHDHLVKLHIKECKVKLCRIEKCEKCLNSSDEMLVIRMSDFGLDDELDDSDEDSSEEDSSEENDEAGDTSAKEDASKVDDQDEDEPEIIEVIFFY